MVLIALSVVVLCYWFSLCSCVVWLLCVVLCRVYGKAELVGLHGFR